MKKEIIQLPSLLIIILLAATKIVKVHLVLNSIIGSRNITGKNIRLLTWENLNIRVFQFIAIAVDPEAVFTELNCTINLSAYPFNHMLTKKLIGPY